MNRMVEPDSGTEDDRSEGVTTAGEWQDDHDAIPVAALLDEDGDTEFADGAVAAFNLVVCEFTFAGIFSEPTSRLHIGSGALKDGRASIQGGSAPATDRTFGPALMMSVNTAWQAGWQTVPEEQLTATDGLTRAIALREIADSLPAFVSSAYFSLQQHQLAEALLSGWIVIEQILNRLWKNEYRPTSRDAGHRARLDDARSFTANVKAELLLASGTLDGDSYDAVQKARKRRNDLAHGGHVDRDGAFECVNAMRAMLGTVVSGDIPRPASSEFVMSEITTP